MADPRKLIPALALLFVATLLIMPSHATSTLSHATHLVSLQVNNGQAQAIVGLDNATYLVQGTIRPQRVTADRISLLQPNYFCATPLSSGIQPTCGGGGGGGGGGTPTTLKVWSGSSYLELPVYLSNPPYPWWTFISTTPTFHVYLDPATAIDTGAALAAITFFMGVLTLYSGGLAVVALVVAGIIALDYGIIYSADHNSNGSFDTYWPIDWYNVFLAYTSHYIYAATPFHWWIVSAVGAYVVTSR